MSYQYPKPSRHPNGSVARGEIKSTLTEKQAKEIYLATDKLKNLAQRYSVGITAIESIKRGRMWKHVTTSLGQAHKNKLADGVKIRSADYVQSVKLEFLFILLKVKKRLFFDPN